MARVHGMMPETLHDERARLSFIVDLKAHLDVKAGVGNARLLRHKVEPSLPKEANAGERRKLAARAMERELPYQNWQALMRSAQELMWDAVSDCVDRQYDQLESRANEIVGDGSVAGHENFEVPHYITAVDTHLMPGSYYEQRHDGDIRQGAVFDLAAAIYHRGRNGQGLNDVRGHTVVSHLYERFPEIQPQSLLEMGCTVGHSTVAVAGYFPKADLHAVDVGLPVLRYASARAKSLGAEVHFAQENAETPSYPDASFDVVYSCVMLHETSQRALPRIMEACYRVLRPGGVVIHLEVPARYKDLSLAEQLRAEYETHYNNEPFWRGACTADMVSALTDAGFQDVAEGYQKAVPCAERGKQQFSSQRGPVYSCWYVVSGRKV